MPPIPPGTGNLQSGNAPGFEWWNPADWFNGLANWFGGLGGDIASGLEAGQIAFIRDLWRVILPFAEIVIGALIAVWALSVYFASTPAGSGILRTVIAMAPK